MTVAEAHRNPDGRYTVTARVRVDDEALVFTAEAATAEEAQADVMEQLRRHEEKLRMRDRIDEGLKRESQIAAELLAELQIDDPDFVHDIVEGETRLLDAIDVAIDEIDAHEIIVAGCKAKKNQIDARQARAETRIARVRALLEQAMTRAELPTARLPTATVTLKALGPRPVVTNEAAIPAEFWKPQAPKLDKGALIAAAKQRPVPGVEMDNGGVQLQIRRS